MRLRDSVMKGLRDREAVHLWQCCVALTSRATTWRKHDIGVVVIRWPHFKLLERVRHGCEDRNTYENNTLLLPDLLQLHLIHWLHKL
jgi:hypothetical protein